MRLRSEKMGEGSVATRPVSLDRGFLRTLLVNISFLMQLSVLGDVCLIIFCIQLLRGITSAKDLLQAQLAIAGTSGKGDKFPT